MPKILCLGDSITYGWTPVAPNYYTAHGGYRGYLWELLWPDHDARPVGTYAEGPVQYGPHEGHPGWKVQDARDHIAEILCESTPDVVLLMIGTNDGLISDWNVTGLYPSLTESLGCLLAAISEEAPDRLTLVGTTPPVGGAYAVGQGWVTAWNACLPLALQAGREAGARCRLVRTGETLTTGDLIDGIHPTDEGYKKLAGAWYAAIVNPPAPLKVA